MVRRARSRRRILQPALDGILGVVASTEISVIVRARDEAASIGRCLELVQAQEGWGVSGELIVVDSGSRDGTPEIARRMGARILRIPRGEFTFGGALNLGAANARGEILVALSAHAFPMRSDWLARLAEVLSDPSVACASGDRHLPDGSCLREAVRQDLELARRHPRWGYSNAAGAFRAELWRRRPFREDLPGGEDREWSLHWIERGYVCMIDPGLLVDHDHTHDPVAAIFSRARREAQGFKDFLDVPPYGLGELLRDWWSDLRFYDSPLRARLSHRRAARMLGEYVGRRR
jgi:rhamnosyltransferase